MGGDNNGHEQRDYRTYEHGAESLKGQDGFVLMNRARVKTASTVFKAQKHECEVIKTVETVMLSIDW